MKAAFLDRDGTLNEMVHYPDHGLVDSPFTPEQMKVKPGACETVNALRERGYTIIVVSNQPGIAKGFFDMQTLDAMTAVLQQHITVDAVYYCTHHPDYTGTCECRKPKPGMLLQAASEHNIDMAESFMVGDGWNDIKAGKLAGVGQTFFLGRQKCDMCHVMHENECFPSHYIKELKDVLEYV